MCYTDAKTPNPSTVCIIFATLAIGTQYAYMESEPAAERGGKRNLGGDDPSVSLFSEDSVGIVFYKQAARLLPDVLALSSLQSIQACLLLGLYVLPVDASGLSHSYLSMAVNLAVQNGMHRHCDAAGWDGRVREIRNRVWWTVITLERYGLSKFSLTGKSMSLTHWQAGHNLPWKANVDQNCRHRCRSSPGAK